jgi:hypothetical protein
VRRERDYVITDSKKNTKIVMRGGGGRREEGGGRSGEEEGGPIMVDKFDGSQCVVLRRQSSQLQSFVHRIL